MSRQLTRTELEQLIYYTNVSITSGEYYGRQDYFIKRHMSIVKWLIELAEEIDHE